MTQTAIISRQPTIEPFLKWAGGKRWFAARHLNLLPTHFNRLVEPFLGGGAMFFALQPAQALLSDLNAELIECYLAVRSYPEAIAAGLETHQAQHAKDHYYRVRNTKPHNDIERAIRFLYLNRTCWNGLYRVNRKNEFNVPIGTKSAVVLPNDDFAAVASTLSKADIFQSDFEETLNMTGPGDFVFVDPPYTVKHNLNGFVKYNDKIFSWPDQVRLRDSVVRASVRGANVLVTNANHPSISELYEGVGHIDVVSRTSVLAASAKHRTSTNELVIRTWLKN